MSSELVLDCTFHVESVSKKGVARVRRTTNRVQVRVINSRSIFYDYDSEHPDQEFTNESLKGVYSALTRKSILLEVDPVLGVTEVELPPEIEKILKLSVKQAYHPEFWFLTGFMSLAGLKAIMRDSFIPLPHQMEVPVTTWSNQIGSWSHPDDFKVTRSFSMAPGKHSKGEDATARVQVNFHRPESWKTLKVLDQLSSGKVTLNAAGPGSLDLNTRHQVTMEHTRKLADRDPVVNKVTFVDTLSIIRTGSCED